MEMVIKQIKTIFYTNGFTYSHIKRSGLITLYEVIHSGGSTVNYEVAILRIMPEESIKGVVYPKRESYPSNEDFGDFGWSHSSLTDAEKHFDRLVKSFRDMQGYDDSRPSAAKYIPYVYPKR